MKAYADPARLAGTLVAVLLCAAGLAGCYTVLKHPGTDVIGLTSFAHQDCYSCHSEAGPGVLYDPMHVPTFDYYADAWYGYYAYPWWQREVWFEDRYGYGGRPDSLGTEIPVGDGSRRTLWGRGSYTPSVLPPNFSSQPGAGAPAAGTAGAAAGGATASPGPGPQEGRTIKHPAQPPPPPNPGGTPPAPVPPPAPAPTPDKDARKDVEKDEDKDPPSAWGRGGDSR